MDGGPSVSRGPTGLALVFDDRGLEITATEPQWHQRIPWTGVAAVTVGTAAPGRSGGVVTPVEVVGSGRRMRFLIGSDCPSVQIAALEQWLAAWSGSAPAPAGLPAGLPAPRATGPSAGAARFAHRVRRVRPARRGRWATLVAGLALVAAGVGLAVGTAGGGSRVATATQREPLVSGDQRLADRVMLTQGDLPPGWKAAGAGTAGSTTSGPSPRSQLAITRAFASCMGVTDRQANVVLGGKGAAAAASPVFVAPTSTAQPGMSVELQTAATVVRNHGDEESDFSLYANPEYPPCAAAAIASELQLGANDATGGHGNPGPAAASVVTIPAPAGEQMTGLIVSFTITDQSSSDPPAPVPAEVEVLSLGSDRIEAELQAFAIGGRLPTGALAGSVSIFEQRVASAGRATAV
jgi:hypothetical protein